MADAEPLTFRQRLAGVAGRTKMAVKNQLSKVDGVMIMIGFLFVLLITNLVLTIVFRHRDCNLEQPVIQIFNEPATSTAVPTPTPVV